MLIVLEEVKTLSDGRHVVEEKYLAEMVGSTVTGIRNLEYAGVLELAGPEAPTCVTVESVNKLVSKSIEFTRALMKPK